MVWLKPKRLKGIVLSQFRVISQLGGVMVLRKTDLVKRVETQFNRPLERLLPEMINENGLSGTADALGVKKSTLNYWLLKLGINVQRVVLAPGETVEVKRPGRV